MLLSQVQVQDVTTMPCGASSKSSAEQQPEQERCINPSCQKNCGAGGRGDTVRRKLQTRRFMGHWTLYAHCPIGHRPNPRCGKIQSIVSKNCGSTVNHAVEEVVEELEGVKGEASRVRVGGAGGP